MVELEDMAQKLAEALRADQRAAAEVLAFKLEFSIASLGHMPPDVFEILSTVLQKLNPRSSSTYILLVNFFALHWSKLTPYQRKQVLEILLPYTAIPEFFESQQAILELCSGQYVR